jgi:hypothetical protein
MLNLIGPRDQITLKITRDLENSIYLIKAFRFDRLRDRIGAIFVVVVVVTLRTLLVGL